MSRRVGLILLSCLALVGTIVLLAQKPVVTAEELSGRWWLEKKTNSSAGYCLNLRYERGDRWSGDHSNWEDSFWVDAAQLHGFRAELLASSGAGAEFDFVRDAGTFHLKGWFSDGSGSGHYKFDPSPQFVAELRKRGLDTPTREQQMRMAMSGMTIEFVDSLKAAGYEFTLDELIRAGNHGVNSEYVKAMQALGYKPATLQLLVRMRDHGVDPEYVRALAENGLKNLSAEEIVKMRDHGVDPTFITELKKYGIEGLSGTELARLRDHGVDPAFISSFEKMGYKLSTEELVRLRDHGVSADFASDVRKAGFQDVTPQELTRLRDHGVSAEYVRKYAKDHSLQEIIRMKDRGENDSL